MCNGRKIHKDPNNKGSKDFQLDVKGFYIWSTRYQKFGDFFVYDLFYNSRESPILGPFFDSIKLLAVPNET